MPRHEGILDYKRTDEQVKNCADTSFTGPKLVPGLLYSVVRRAIRDWMERKHIEFWKSSKDYNTPRPPWKGLNKAGQLNYQA